MAVVHIGIGSNLGDLVANCVRALSLLEGRGIEVTKRSSLFETEPWGVKDQPRFRNMAAEIITVLPPHELLIVLKEIEVEMGRSETTRWGPRIIDLDILFYDALILDSPELKIPHPHLQERDFVLKPLAEIAPNKIHPVLKKTIQDLIRSSILPHNNIV